MLLDRITLLKIMLRAAGVVYRAVLTGVEVVVFVIRKRWKRSRQNGAHERLERLEQTCLLLMKRESELVEIQSGDHERLDRGRDVPCITGEEFRRSHGI